jgi:hypothetical protein
MFETFFLVLLVILSFFLSYRRNYYYCWSVPQGIYVRIAVNIHVRSLSLFFVLVCIYKRLTSHFLTSMNIRRMTIFFHISQKICLFELSFFSPSFNLINDDKWLTIEKSVYIWVHYFVVLIMCILLLLNDSFLLFFSLTMKVFRLSRLFAFLWQWRRTEQTKRA